MVTPTLNEVRSLPFGKEVPARAKDILVEDGVVGLRGAFGPQWLDLIEEGIDLALNGASTDVDIVKRPGDAGSFSFSSQAWRNVEPFRQFIFDSHIADIAWALLDTRQLVLFYDFLLIKQPRSDSAATPWHQDHSYYPLDGTQVINCWIALDDIPEASALRFMRASHRAATLFRAINFERPEQDYRHARKELPLPPGDDEPSVEVLVAPVSRGDMLVWKSYTLHSAPGNRLDRRRAAFSVNWLGDDVRYNAKASLETYRDPALQVGAPMTCEKFPMLRGA